MKIDLLTTITWKTLAFLFLAALPVSAAVGDEISTTDFTSGDSFSAGAINGQGTWKAKGKAEIDVDDEDKPAGVALFGFESVVNSEASPKAVVKPGTTYTSTVTFTYEDDSKGEDRNGPHVGASIFAGPSPGKEVRINLSRSGNKFRFNLATNFGNKYVDFDGDGKHDFNQSPVVDNSDLGFDFSGGDAKSDVLRLSISLTASDKPDQWTAKGVLFNETTGQEVLSWVPHLDGDETFTFDADVGSTLHAGFGGGQSDDNQNVANRLVTKHAFSTAAEDE